jgi:hypothetical protein
VVFLPTMSGENVNLGSGQPCVSVICKTCGSSQLFNVFLAGLGDALGIKAAAPTNEKTSG